jgi:excisionase family DNA binding protein
MACEITADFNEGLWDAKDVAQYLKVSRSWVYLHAEDGTLPSVRIGGLRRFWPDQIRAYARGEEAPPPAVLDFPGRGR